MKRARLHASHSGFTLLELMVSIAVLAIIVVAVAQMLGMAGLLTTNNNKHMDANDQSRAVFDRMANDFARMVRRKDVDYIFWKWGTPEGASTPGNDAMYFYTEGDSYFGTTTFSSSALPAGSTDESEKNEVSLVGYRVNNNPASVYSSGTNPDYYRLERLGKALSCDGGGYNSSQPAANNSVQPNVMVFLTYPPAGIDAGALDQSNFSITYSTAFFMSTLAGAYSNNSNQTPGILPSAVGTYPGAGLSSTFNDSLDTNYHPLGSQVFRFEYSFQLKDGTLSDKPVMTQSASNGLPFSFFAGNGTGRPLPTDDSKNNAGDGTFAVGSRWWDPTNQIGYICLDATPNYAIWHEIGIQDISAIIVTIAVIDKQGLIYVQKSGIDLATLAAQFPDYVAGNAPGNSPENMLNPSSTYKTTSWVYAITPTSAGGKSPVATAAKIPQSMVSQIRVYQRYFYLNSF